jgi:release factor glutamine methyltransferase
LPKIRFAPCLRGEIVQVKQILSSAIARLTADEVPSPRLNAELLLMFTLNCDRAYLFAHPERALTTDEQSRYESALAERARGVPTQYITGHQEFWGMDLIVTPAVLIPRPETEHVVENVLELASVEWAGGQECPPRVMRVLDLGTGSGCIALALAKEFPHAQIHASDISAGALEIARANAVRLQFEHRIQFHEADLFQGLDLTELDLVVSNPPYVGESEEDHVQLEVRKFEPRPAVFAGPTGTEILARLIPQAQAALRPGGWLVMEISGTIADATKVLLSGWDDLRISPDLQSIPRVARARKPRR